MEIVPVPYALQAELDWQPRTTRRRLTELLTRKVGAPHLDAENPELQELFCGLSEEIAAAVAKRDTLPDPDHMRRVAEKAVAQIDYIEDLVVALGLARRRVECEVCEIDAALQRLASVEVARLLRRATITPPKRKRRRAA